MSAPSLVRLGRADTRPSPPIRIVHLGLGNFFRAHQAWYTDTAPDAADWGIAAFTGRSTALADALSEQGGAYTLVSRGAGTDSARVIGSLAATHAGGDQRAFLDYLARPEVALVTLTVTEAGYRRGPDGGLDAAAPDVTADVAALRGDPSAPVSTVPLRLAAGLAARRAADAGPITIVSCDNLPDNGAVTRRVVTDAAALLDPGLPGWIAANVGFVTTMVDRITPATTDADRIAVAELTGRADEAPVITEPYTEWVLAGEFRAGRPAWQASGARFVADVVPFEHRKLWLLNGAHSLLAYAGSARGHLTVAEAMGDPDCVRWLDEWWNDAARHLTLPAADIDDYRRALLERFGNARIRHLLAQIAADGSQKIAVRVVPVVRAERTAGRLPIGALRVAAAWLNHLRGAGAPVKDVAAEQVCTLAAGDLSDGARRLLGHLDPEFGADDELVGAVVDLAGQLSG